MDAQAFDLPFDPPTLKALSAQRGGGEPMAPAMALALSANFGSVERWRAEFAAMGKASSSRAGWVVLTFQPREGTLVNQWAADHAHGVAGGVPLLALDMHEHTSDPDSGAAADMDVDAVMAHVNWPGVHARYQQAVAACSESLGASPDDLEGVHVIDVRRAAVFQESDTIIPGALWCDPLALAVWAPVLPRGETVVVYCVHGHDVSRAVAMRLRAAGVDARFLLGGIEGWKAAGRPLVVKGAAA